MGIELVVERRTRGGMFAVLYENLGTLCVRGIRERRKRRQTQSTLRTDLPYSPHLGRHTFL